MTAHWSVADEAAMKGMPDEIALTFHDGFVVLDRSIGLFTSQPLAALQQLDLREKSRGSGEYEFRTGPR
jgi:hypothetical protein